MSRHSRAQAVVELPLPITAHITPSSFNEWRGAREQGERWTNRQRNMMAYLGIDASTVDGVTVRSAVTARDMCLPLESPPHAFVFECPVLRRRGGQILVLSPAGGQRWVHPDGTISHRLEPRRGSADFVQPKSKVAA